MVSLRSLLTVVFPVRERLMCYLGATDLARLMAVARCAMSNNEKVKYLAILRDFPEYEERFTNLLKTGHSITLVGKDLRFLWRRIHQPLTFWAIYKGNERLTLWAAILRQDGFQYDCSIFNADCSIFNADDGHYYEQERHKLKDAGLVPHCVGGDVSEFLSLPTVPHVYESRIPFAHRRSRWDKQWHGYSKSNENGIKLVEFHGILSPHVDASRHAWLSGPSTQLADLSTNFIGIRNALLDFDDDGIPSSTTYLSLSTSQDEVRNAPVAYWASQVRDRLNATSDDRDILRLVHLRFGSAYNAYEYLIEIPISQEPPSLVHEANPGIQDLAQGLIWS